MGTYESLIIKNLNTISSQVSVKLVCELKIRYGNVSLVCIQAKTSFFLGWLFTLRVF